MKTGMMKLEMVGVAALAILATTLPAQAADGTWTNAAGGTWATAGNWQGSVLPDTGNANLTMTGVNYAVNYDAAAPAVSNLVVSNKAPYQTAMVVSAPLTNIGSGTITLDVGARVSVTNNGAWTATGNSTGTRVMTIKNGAEPVSYTHLTLPTNREV